MKFLLDTVVWLWSVGSVEKINRAGREVLDNQEAEIYFSPVSSWELSIKTRLGKLHLPAPPAQCIPAFMSRQGLRPLPVSHLHAFKVYDLPLFHHDPFDRLLIAQAVFENLTILTSDRVFEKYPVDVLWCGR